jgi:hypothetical protein
MTVIGCAVPDRAVVAGTLPEAPQPADAGGACDTVTGADPNTWSTAFR